MNKNTLEISNGQIHHSEKLTTIRIAEHFKMMHSNKFVMIKTNEQLYFSIVYIGRRTVK
jgi:hypothetical protein